MIVIFGKRFFPNNFLDDRQVFKCQYVPVKVLHGIRVTRLAQGSATSTRVDCRSLLHQKVNPAERLLVSAGPCVPSIFLYKTGSNQLYLGAQVNATTGDSGNILGE